MDELKQYLSSLIGAVELHNRAGENGFLIESVCLASSIVDAQLRMGLVLESQIRTASRRIPTGLLYEPDMVKGMLETQTYKRAFDTGVITQELYDRLRALYKERNKVIHRYVISGITTADVLEIALRYDRLIPEISEVVWKLESKQIELGVGMTVSGPAATEEGLKDMSRWKHGWLAEAIRRKQ